MDLTRHVSENLYLESTEGSKKLFKFFMHICRGKGGIKFIKVYYRGGSNSSQKALKWFENYGIEIEKIKISHISSLDMIIALSCTDRGFDELIKKKRRSTTHINVQLHNFDNLSFNETLAYLKQKSMLLRDPIILDGKNCLIGFNPDIIRQFFPKEYRDLLKRF